MDLRSDSRRNSKHIHHNRNKSTPQVTDSLQALQLINKESFITSLENGAQGLEKEDRAISVMSSDYGGNR